MTTIRKCFFSPAEDCLSCSLTHVTRRTIISDTLTNLIKILDEVEKIFWKTEFDSTSNPDFYVLRVRFFQYKSI